MIRSHVLSRGFLNIISNECYPALAGGKRFMSKSWKEEHLEAPQGGAPIPDNVSVRQRRIIYRSKQRGWLELDILMGGWAAKHVPKMEDDSSIAEVEHLLDADTPKVLKWVLGQEVPPPEYQTNVMKSLQDYAQGVDRNDMNIVAAPKGLVVGNVTFVDETANEINVSMFGIDGCLIPSRPERIPHISSDASAILVIEKEASFQCLLHEIDSHEFSKSSVFVTGKGYPDHATRQFLRRLLAGAQAEGKQIPTYLLTDADPHGICIAMCYLRSLTEYDVRWLGVKPSEVEREFTIDSRSRFPLHESELSLLPNLLKRCCADDHTGDEEYMKFRSELMFMKNNGVKYEMEALSIVRNESGVSGLLLYLIDKIREEEIRCNFRHPFQAIAVRQLMLDIS